MQGKKPKESTLQLIEGGLSNVPEAPAWLNVRAKAIWRTIAPELVERKILAETDLGTLANYCATNAIIQECQAAFDSDGLFEHSERSGTSRPSAAFKMIMQAQMVGARLAAELGLSPASRNKAAKIETNEASSEGWGNDLLA